MLQREPIGVIESTQISQLQTLLTGDDPHFCHASSVVAETIFRQNSDRTVDIEMVALMVVERRQRIAI